MVHTSIQGMPYIPNKLEQYAESVITAVSVECDGVHVPKSPQFLHMYMYIHRYTWTIAGSLAMFVCLLYISAVLCLLPCEAW